MNSPTVMEGTDENDDENENGDFEYNGDDLVDCPTQLICTWIFICCVP